MKDYSVTATSDNGRIRAVACQTTEMANTAQKVHNLYPVSCTALSRVLTAVAMMSLELKGNKDNVTLQIKGNGPLGGIVAISDAFSNVRGYVHNPDVELPLNSKGKIDVSAAVGKGYLNVIKDLGLKEPYLGFVNLISGEIAEDLAYYYAFSEQIPTIVSLGVLIAPEDHVLHAGGFLIQLMPGADEDTISFLEKATEGIKPYTTLMSEGLKPEEILEGILKDKGLNIIDKRPLRYHCNCSRERMEKNLISLGKNELEDIINDQHQAELQCHFCNSKYNFSEKELKDLANLL